MTFARRRFLQGAGSVAALALACPSLASAADLPKGPVRIVVGFPPGGGTDILARLLATHLGNAWKIPVVVENRAGAAGVIAAVDVAKAAADGNTLMMGHINSLAIAPGLNSKLSYAPQRDFSPIALVGKTPQILIARHGDEVRTVPELIALCKEKPGQVLFGSAGAGSAQHLALALFQQRSGVEVTHVPYKGSAPLVTDMIGGHVRFAFEGATTASVYMRDNRLTGIAQTPLRRSAAFPALPTVAEAALPDFEASIWFGMVGPAGLPAPMVTRMNADIDRILAMPEVVSRLKEFGAEDGGGSVASFQAYMQAEEKKWSDLIRSRNISVES